MEFIIEKLIYGGDGLARLPADERGRGKAVFIPLVLAGERVEAELVEEKPGFARARLERVLQPSPARMVPGCRYFGDCGGCHYQHTSYEQQLHIKTEILGETLRRIAKLEPPGISVHASPPWNYRNRTRMGVRTRPEFVLGYRRFGSHMLLAIEECPISSPLINRAIRALWELGRAGVLGGELSEIEFFANAEDSQLLLELTMAPGFHFSSAAEMVLRLRQQVPEILGAAVFVRERGGSLRRQDVPQELEKNFGKDELTYSAGGMDYRVAAGSFFQSNRFLIDELLSLVTEDRSGDIALDLYAGVGLFSLPLSQSFREVAAVEAGPFAFHDLRRNSPSNVSGYRVEADTFLAQLPEGARFDYVVVDPPRTGLGEKLAMVLAGLKAARLTYVSCDPATLARDLRVLVNAGYRLEETHLIDLFPQTFHIETVVRLAR